jgi:hypothetical protein
MFRSVAGEQSPYDSGLATATAPSLADFLRVLGIDHILDREPGIRERLADIARSARTSSHGIGESNAPAIQSFL